ncbi:GNAT family N-acetyltransferase [Streptomyces sp. NPDC001020]
MTVERVTLRPAAEDDLSLLERFLTDREAAAPFLWFGWWDPGRWRREWAENRLLGDDQGMLMVVRDDEVLGFVGFRKVWASRTSYYWNIGIALMPEARGKGAGTEAQRQLVRYLFAHTVVERVEADTEVENIAEQHSLEKAGFTREGLVRSVVFRDGQWRDGVRYSILRREAAEAASR